MPPISVENWFAMFYHFFYHNFSQISIFYLFWGCYHDVGGTPFLVPYLQVSTGHIPASMDSGRVLVPKLRYGLKPKSLGLGAQLFIS